jgi:hypothetical protein
MIVIIIVKNNRRYYWTQQLFYTNDYNIYDDGYELCNLG